MVELEDHVNDKDEVWSKIKHGLAAFKSQLPPGVAAVVTNDDFGDTSALLITLESDTRSYRELKGYMDDLSDRLRRIESVSNLRPYGVQQEQISIYADHERLAAYGIGEKVLSAALASQGLTPMGGSVGNAETETPIHIAPALAGEREVAEQIIWSDPQGHVLRVKDVARVVREYDDPDSYIRNNGHRCVMLSMEMKAGASTSCNTAVTWTKCCTNSLRPSSPRTSRCSASPTRPRSWATRCTRSCVTCSSPWPSSSW